MAKQKQYFTRAGLIDLLGLRDKSQQTIYRAIQKLHAGGAPRIPISGGRWDADKVYAAMESLEKMAC